jgi:hypothetical protein
MAKNNIQNLAQRIMTTHNNLISPAEFDGVGDREYTEDMKMKCNCQTDCTTDY